MHSFLQNLVLAGLVRHIATRQARDGPNHTPQDCGSEQLPAEPHAGVICEAQASGGLCQCSCEVPARRPLSRCWCPPPPHVYQTSQLAGPSHPAVMWSSLQVSINILKSLPDSPCNSRGLHICQQALSHAIDPLHSTMQRSPETRLHAADMLTRRYKRSADTCDTCTAAVMKNKGQIQCNQG